MQVNLARLQDLTAELRRQLKPLGRQADVARRAAVVQADVRDGLRLLADDLEQLRAALDREISDEEALLGRRADVEQALDDRRSREAELTEALNAEGPLLARAQETWYHLSAVRERFRGTDRSRLSASASSRPRLTTRAVAVTPSSSSARLHRPAPRSAPCVPTSRRTAAV